MKLLVRLRLRGVDSRMARGTPAIRRRCAWRREKHTRFRGLRGPGDALSSICLWVAMGRAYLTAAIYRHGRVDTVAHGGRRYFRGAIMTPY